MTDKLHLYSVMYLDADHTEEICEDIRLQYENGIANRPIFSITLVPEGNPPVNKAEKLCKTYKIYKEKLDSLNIPSGVLVQASIGHGWILGEPASFQKLVDFSDGTVRSGIICPLDEGFKQYIYDALRTIALCRPDYIMIDDDLRLIARNGQGCGCPLHMKRVCELAGRDITREELRTALTEDTENNRELYDIFLKTQKEAVVEVARVMREAIDSVDPKIPGSFCCVGENAEFAAEIAGAVAGEGNPVTIRINNGNYTAPGSKNLSNVFFRAATQIEKIKDAADIILDEPDTCPQNRYSTSASMLHAHMTGGILEGVQGAKHWITRSYFEPQSGVAYRRMLKKYSLFYTALARSVEGIRWKGFRVPLLGKAEYVFDSYIEEGRTGGHWGGIKEQPNGWVSCVLERFGLPVYFSSQNGGIVCLEGNCDECLDDEQMKKALSGYAFISSDSAKRIIKRGFGKYLGVDIREWKGKQPTSEKIYTTGERADSQIGFKEIVPLDSSVIIHSRTEHSLDKRTYEALFPGVTEFENELGGRVFVFCGTPKTNYDLTTAFSYLNYSRKQQFIELASKTGEIPVYYPGDEEVYMKCGILTDGSYLAAIFNISMDKIDMLELATTIDFTKIHMLSPEGRWQEVEYQRSENGYILDIPCEILIPVILKIS